MSRISPHIYLSISPISHDSFTHVHAQDLLANFLAADQHEKLENINTPTRKAEFVGVRTNLFNLYLNYELGLRRSVNTRAEVQLTQDTFGRPYLKRTKRSTRDVQETIDTQINKDNEEGAAIPSVSLSHSKQWLAVVISDQSSIGIDIETPNRMVSEALKRRFFTQQEQKSVIFSDYPVWLWVIKEAVVKCIGKGIQADLTKVVVQMADKEASTTENWSFDWHPSKPRGQERVYRFYAHYASMEWFEGRIWIHPLYVCAIAIPSQNEGGKNE